MFKGQTVWNPSLFIFLLINSYISFIEIKNLIKKKTYLAYPITQKQELSCRTSKNVGSYMLFLL